MSGGPSFNLCEPGVPSGSPIPNWSVHIRLLGGARRTALGATEFDAPYGGAQVTLSNGWPFGPSSGIALTGHIPRGSIVLIAYVPSRRNWWPSPGYAFWHVPSGTSALRLMTSGDGRAATLTVAGRAVAPVMVVPPAVVTHPSAAVRQTFAATMQHLEAIAAGNDAGACDLFPPLTPKPTDQWCAGQLGIRGTNATIEAAATHVAYKLYNGWLVAVFGVPINYLPGLIWDNGQFRLPIGYTII